MIPLFAFYRHTASDQGLGLGTQITTAQRPRPRLEKLMIMRNVALTYIESGSLFAQVLACAFIFKIAKKS